MVELIYYDIECGIIFFDYVDIYGDYIIEIEFGIVFKESFIVCENIEIILKCGI